MNSPRSPSFEGPPRSLLLDKALLHGLFVDRLEREALARRVHLTVRQPELLRGLRVREVPVLTEEDGLRVILGHGLRALWPTITLLIRTIHELVDLRDDVRELRGVRELLDFGLHIVRGGLDNGVAGLGVDDISPSLVE